MSEYDKEKIEVILLGHGDWFTAHLIRLIGKADTSNLELIRKGFPEEVKAVEDFYAK